MIEVLYPEICGLYGDSFNAKYLEMSMPDAKFIYTDLGSEPRFVKEKVDLIYIGSMTEYSQEIVIKKLLKCKDKIIELINNNTLFLVTGNATHLFGKAIYKNGKKIEALGIFDYYTKQDFSERYHNLYMGKYKDINIIGFKSDFGKIYNSNNKFIDTTKGMGNNEEDLSEGINYKEFYATTILGPFLIQNPLFCKHIIKKIDPKNRLLYEKELMDAYEERLKEYKSISF